MCVDSPVRPDDMQGPPVGLWPCHLQGGNQVFSSQLSSLSLANIVSNKVAQSSGVLEFRF